MTLTELIERLEKADAGSRELDERIAKAVTWMRRGNVWIAPGETHGSTYDPPAFSPVRWTPR